MQARIVSTAAEDAVSAFLSALQATGVRVRLSEGLLLSLNASPELTTQVEHAVDALRARFPTIALTLQHYQDPEIEEEEFVMLLARLDAYPPDFWEVFDQIRETVLASASPQDGIRLHITTDLGRE